MNRGKLRKAAFPSRPAGAVIYARSLRLDLLHKPDDGTTQLQVFAEIRDQVPHRPAAFRSGRLAAVSLACGAEGLAFLSMQTLGGRLIRAGF